ncbi:MAG: hypothetical protein EPN85_06020 [Bacteroidetes bacterium]|nr:MAG: hypothetical protein EPN85_06020 [Bacteroidota bacterium]
MKRFSLLLSVLLLGFLVLLGSGGFTIGKMICGGNECASTYTLGKAKDCCASENTSKESISCCCELIDVSYTLDEFSVSAKMSIAAVEFDFFHARSAFVFPLPSSFLHLPCPDPLPPDPRGYLYCIGSLLL